jgi:hypothetical protein
VALDSAGGVSVRDTSLDGRLDMAAGGPLVDALFDTAESVEIEVDPDVGAADVVMGLGNGVTPRVIVRVLPSALTFSCDLSNVVPSAGKVADEVKSPRSTARVMPPTQDCGAGPRASLTSGVIGSRRLNNTVTDNS